MRLALFSLPLSSADMSQHPESTNQRSSCLRIVSKPQYGAIILTADPEEVCEL